MKNIKPIEKTKNFDEFIDQFSSRQIHLLGISSQELRAILEFLLSKNIKNLVLHDNVDSKHLEENFIRMDDSRTSEQSKKLLKDFQSEKFKWNLGKNYGDDIKSGDLVIASQAYFRFAQNQKVIKQWKLGKIELIQAMEIVFKIAPCKTIGITGTVGKSTVNSMTFSIFKSAGGKVYFSGNDRENRWDLIRLSKMGEKDWAIIEVSNRHLKDLKISPHIAVLTNLFPHHLDDHGNFKQYIYDKTNIVRYQKKGDFAILNQEIIDQKLIHLHNFKSKFLSFKVRPFETDQDYKTREISIFDDENHKIKIINLRDLYLPSEHIASAALASAITANCAKIPISKISTGLKNFKGLKYRMEMVGKIKSHKIYNDGKCTDPIGTIAAIKSIIGPKILIMGGIREGIKKGDFDELGKEIEKPSLPAGRSQTDVIIYGASKKEIAKQFNQIVKNYFMVEDLNQAVKKAFELGQKNETIIYSPACQSMDQFKDYRERAEMFNKLIKKV